MSLDRVLVVARREDRCVYFHVWSRFFLRSECADSRHTARRRAACWMDVAADARQIPRMIHLDFTDDELQDAAQAARVASVQADKDAERQSNPRIKAMFDGTARRFA